MSSKISILEWFLKDPCDTEDWRNDAENAALITGINYILQGIHIENKLFWIVKIFHNCTDFTVFLFKRNAALVNRRDFFQKKKKSFVTFCYTIRQLACFNYWKWVYYWYIN